MKALLTTFILGLGIPSAVSMAAETQIHVKGIYTVPVETGDRSAAAFDTEYCLHFDEEKNLIGIDYKLPEFLAPKDQWEVSLAEPERTRLGFIELSGPNGLASCSLNHARLVCLVAYPAISYDLGKHLEQLSERWSPEVMSHREPVIRLFHHEPEGIIEISKEEIGEL